MVGCSSRIRASSSFKTSGVTALRAYQPIKKICRHVFEETPLKPGYSGWLTASVKPCMLLDLNTSFNKSSMASLINKETGNMKLSQAQLGHANVQITADVYTHVDETQKKRAAEALERGILGNL